MVVLLAVHLALLSPDWREYTTERRAELTFMLLGEEPRLLRRGETLLRFVDAGKMDDASPLLFVHGLGGSLGDFGPVMAALAKTRRVLAVDLPGFGGSQTHSADYTVSGFARVLRDFVHAAGLSRVNLVCHSLGGQVCLYLALGQPDFVRSLTLVDPAGTYAPQSFISGVTQRLGRINIGAVPIEKGRSLAALFTGDHVLFGRFVASTPFLLAALRSFDANLRQEVHAVSAPTLLVWGERDPLFAVDNAFFLKDNLPHAELHLVAGAGHSPQLEQPELVARFVTKFLEAQ